MIFTVAKKRSETQRTGYQAFCELRKSRINSEVKDYNIPGNMIRDIALPKFERCQRI